MSRIGKLPVELPDGVKVSMSGRKLIVEGSKGKLEQEIQPEVDIEINDKICNVQRKNESKRARSMHGLYRKLLHNMVIGVSAGYEKVLVINGVGYRAEVKGQSLQLNLGYSNPVEYVLDKDISVKVEGNEKIILNCIDKQKLGQVCSEIRSLRPPEPYKGKGIRYENEYVRRKVGKAGIK